MQRPRRKTILLYSLVFIALLLLSGYIFRYSLVLGFQYARLKSLDCDRSGKTENCLQRIWVHRVNSIERYQALQSKFNGFETDVVFEKSSHRFSVYHPPLEIPGDDTLSLDAFLGSVDLRDNRFWLDIRGVYSHNKEEALASFSRLQEKFNLRDACIIELYDLSSALLFAENGYTVSFNVSGSLLQELQSGRIQKDSMEHVLAPVKYISQDARLLPALKQVFPGKKILTWHLFFNDFIDTKPVQRLLDDPQVEIILVNIKSRYYK